MKLNHQILTASLGIINLLQIKIYRCYQNIFTNFNKIKYKPLVYHIEEDQNKIYMSGEIYR